MKIHIFPDSDDCTRDACNGNGECIDLVNDFTCHCDSGYEGGNCEQSEYLFDELQLS